MAFLRLDAPAFVFNVVRYHAIRSEHGLVGDLPQKLEAVLNMLGINLAYDSTSFQSVLLVVPYFAGLVSTVARRERMPLSTSIAGVLVAVSLLPTPTYAQYFCMAVPFVVVDAVRFASKLAAEASIRRPDRARVLARALAVVGGLYLAVTPIAIHRYTAGGDNVPGVFVAANAANWSIAAVNSVARAIDQEMPDPGAAVLSWWPGYFVEARARIFPRLENPFAYWHSSLLSPEEVMRFHFITDRELVTTIETHAVPLVVLGNWLYPGQERYRQLLVQSGYVMVRKVQDTELYRAPGPRTSSR